MSTVTIRKESAVRPRNQVELAEIAQARVDARVLAARISEAVNGCIGAARIADEKHREAELAMIELVPSSDAVDRLLEEARKFNLKWGETKLSDNGELRRLDQCERPHIPNVRHGALTTHRFELLLAPARRKQPGPAPRPGLVMREVHVGRGAEDVVRSGCERWLGEKVS